MGNNENIDKNALLNAILSAGGGKINQNAVDRAKKGDVSGIVDSLDEENKRKIKSALNDREKLREILASKQAREIFKKFSGGSNNGRS